MWFTADGGVGKITPAGVLTEYPPPVPATSRPAAAPPR